MHPVGAADADAVVGDVRRAAAITAPGLLMILDVGRTRLDDGEVAYVVTSRWDHSPTTATFDDDELVNPAQSLAQGLATLHRAGLTHGAIHRQAIREADGQWLLGEAGLGPVTTVVGAPYRPSGLHVLEPLAPAADMWSLGVLLHELAAGYLLRPGETPRLPGFPRTERLAHALLASDPAERLTAEQVVAGGGLTPGAPTVAAGAGSTGAGPTVNAAPPAAPQRPVVAPPQDATVSADADPSPAATAASTSDSIARWRSCDRRPAAQSSKSGASSNSTPARKSPR